MIKADLVEVVALQLEMTRNESEVIIDTIFDSIVQAVRRGDKIEIRGFGAFCTRQRHSRVGRNPKTGARVEVPGKRILYFKPSKNLANLVNSFATPVKPAPASQPDVSSEGALTLRADRVPFRYLVELILESGRRRSVRTVNISQSGMLVESVLPIKTGARVRIRTNQLPFLCVGASIRRCTRQWFVYRIGLEFDSLLSTLF